MVRCFYGNDNFLDDIKNLEPLFCLSATHTKTAEIKNITAAGLDGYTSYTPALDYEMLSLGRPLSLPNIAMMPEGPPSPVLISKAVKNLCDFEAHFLDLGVEIVPKTDVVSFGAKPTDSILNGSGVDARGLFYKGVEYAKKIANTGRLFMLSECVPGGTTTAFALMSGLGYECDGLFSSSKQCKTTKNLKLEVVKKALKTHKSSILSPFDAVHFLGDNMQPFVAGLATELSKECKVVLSGGTQMASVLALIKALDESPNYQNIALWSTKWIYEDQNSDIEELLKLICVPISAFFADFDFANSKYKNLKLYEKGMVKEGVGAGALLVLAYLRGFSKAQLLDEIERLYGGVQG